MRFSKENFLASSSGNNRSQAPLVGNGPGAIALRRIPCRAHSNASDLVMVNTPALAMADGTTQPEPVVA
ncbi:hypothetical protein D3C86_1921780 [compost metagenome]